MAVGSSAVGLSLRWPIGGSAFEWDAVAGRWVRFDPESQEDLAFTSVIALSLEVQFLGGNDASGTPIPTMVTEGTGSGIVATGGQVYDITWSKATPDDPWQFTYQPEGATEPVPFPVPPGRSWLALLPPEGQVSVEPGAAVSAEPSTPQP